MSDAAEQLDAALDRPLRDHSDSDISTLLQVADEVRSVLQQPPLTRADRERLYARATQLARRGRRWATARHLILDHKLRALAGGAAVTLAAGTAITVALVRQHRHHAPLPV
ncbi:MAG: hypothetical protein JOZ92_08365 [Candidatus Dormibacteraeota bacterium]|nr:hypothetical protein [Candidatus Dormibacteraeota bacterium]